MRGLLWWLVAGGLLWPAIGHGGGDDGIFHSGVEPGLTISGRAFWPSPLAGAVVEAHFGNQAASTTARADGSYGLVVEYRHVVGDQLVELRARGHGAQAHIQWRGQLGSVERLIDAAGGDEILDFTEEAFVHLTPYSTAVTAFMRADNGFSALTTFAQFERSARAQQFYVGSITHALALVAHGDLGLPNEATDTWQAVATLANSQRLYADYMKNRPSQPCFDQPTHPHCAVRAALLFDDAVYPALDPEPGEIHVFTPGYDYYGSLPTQAFSIDGGIGRYQHESHDSVLHEVQLQAGPDNGFVFQRADGEPLGVTETTAWMNGGQVRLHIETLDAYIRLSRGVGGLVNIATARTIRWRYPDNPEIPDLNYPAEPGFPVLSSVNPLPETQMGDLVPVANSRWVITAPFDSVNPGQTSNPAPQAADIHAFGVDGGLAERAGVSFVLLEQQADRLLLDYPGATVETRLLNQDYAGVWRTFVTIDRPGGLRIVRGILMKVEEPQPMWTAASVPGLYRARTPNGFQCDGPYGDLEALYSGRFCGPPHFSFQFNADGTGIQDPNGVFPVALTWALPGGVDLGRLRFGREVSGMIAFSRGWEIVKISGDRYWILENYYAGPPAPPLAYTPTQRVVQYQRQ